MSIDFIVNEPNHSEYWLPDRVHTFSQSIHGNSLYFCVTDRVLGKTKESGTVRLNDAKWRDLISLAQDLASKKYAAKKDRNIAAYHNSYKK